MIWVGGRIVADDELRISVLDRTFEHGLGLFETFRTWNGHATLLDRHLARLTRSARELGLPLDPAALPDASSVTALLRADGRLGDAVLRITMSGGLSESSGSVVWMRSAPLPPPLRDEGAWIGGSWSIPVDDPLAAHKTLNYWRKRLAYERARAEGCDETLSLTDSLLITEGSRTNLFMVHKGDLLVTPRLDGMLLPGIMRQLVLERAERLGLAVDETLVAEGTLDIPDEVFLTNSVRGIIPVGRVFDRIIPAPGPVTRRLRDDLLPWLELGGALP